MRTIFLGLAALLCCATSHAATITADGVFVVAVHGGDEGPIFDPPLLGEGSFSLRENRWAAFSFDMLGHHWSIDDVDPRRCHVELCSVDANGDLDHIVIEFADEAGGGFLVFAFLQDFFSMGVTVGDTGVGGTSDKGTANIESLEFSHRINLPAPGSLTLLTLGLLGLGWIRRPAHARRTRSAARVRLAGGEPAKVVQLIHQRPQHPRRPSRPVLRHQPHQEVPARAL